MKQLSPIREAQRIFVVIVVGRMVIGALGLLARVGLQDKAPIVALEVLPLQLAPTLLVLAIAALPAFERILGPGYLALAIALDILNLSLYIAPAFFVFHAFPASSKVAISIAVQPGFEETIWSEPLLMLLIPLVLMAWAYGRKGALWGSTWTSLLHVGTGLWALQLDLSGRALWAREVMRLALIYAVPLVVSILARRERRQMAALAEAHARLQRHAATVEQLAVSRERVRLARDLHDTLAHSLAALAVQLEALRTVQAHDPAQAQRVAEEALALARAGLDESRRAIQSLRADPVAALGLVGAVRGLLQGLETRTGVAVELAVAGEENDLTTDEASALYRIAEEALNNIERHAGAHKVSARLAFGDDRTDLEIADDGVGFDPAAVGEDRYGLMGMRERAALIGATYEVTSIPGQGARVVCSLRR